MTRKSRGIPRRAETKEGVGWIRSLFEHRLDRGGQGGLLRKEDKFGDDLSSANRGDMQVTIGVETQISGGTGVPMDFQGLWYIVGDSMGLDGDCSRVNVADKGWTVGVV